MPVIAKAEGYKGEVKDRVENFHGNQLLYICWEDHTMFCAPSALAVPPAMAFGDLIERVLPTTSFVEHPDWEKIDWKTVEWEKSGASFSPDPAKSLSENGLGHKAYIVFRTPGLSGIAGSHT